MNSAYTSILQRRALGIINAMIVFNLKQYLDQCEQGRYIGDQDNAIDAIDNDLARRERILAR